jgi:hypothetical protein
MVIRTTWEYSPVQSTRRNSADSEGKAFIMLGKYCISCLGGPVGILGSFPSNTADLESVLLAGMDVKDAYLEQ